MHDIFVSYSSKDRDVARRVAAALEKRGWSVWWDLQIPPGRQYDEVIVEALRSVRCVVVLWSSASSESMWVKNEAADAMGRHNLIPAMIEPGITPPFEFRRLQAANLSEWKGDADDPAFRQLCDAIATLVSGDRDTASQPAPPRPVPPPPLQPPAPAPAAPSAPMPLRTKVWIGLAIAFGAPVLVSLLFGGALQDHGTDSPPVPLGPQTAPGTAGSGAQTTSPLAWRDRSLRYTGTVTWDAREPTAQLHLSAFDGKTGGPIAQTTLSATAQLDAPGRYVFTAQLPVPGDSETPRPHGHALHLVFEMRNGQLVLVRNCTTPNDCYEVGT